jgi:hypothetical protein
LTISGTRSARSRTARLSNDTATIFKATDALLGLYFKNQDSSTTVRNELLQFEPKFQSQIIDKIREYAKKEDQRTATEDLLQVPIKDWWGKDLSRAAADTYQEPPT